jgi:hypothetical protein
MADRCENMQLGWKTREKVRQILWYCRARKGERARQGGGAAGTGRLLSRATGVYRILFESLRGGGDYYHRLFAVVCPALLRVSDVGIIHRSRTGCGPGA